MTASLLDGRLVSNFLLQGVSHKVSVLKKEKITPKLVIILVGDSPASLSYISQKSRAAEKTGIICEVKKLPSSTTTKNLIVLIEKLNKDKKTHGILVQLPLPKQIETPLIIRAIDPKKDVDGFNAYNLGKMFLSRGFERLAPCTPLGIIKLLEHYKISLSGKNVTIVGRSNIVGKPLAVMLINRDATVTVCHSKTKNLSEYTKKADILVAAVGRPKFITAKMVKSGAVVIDVGVNKVDGKLIGDSDFKTVSKKASALTPVPGGIGPMTVACLMENVLKAAEQTI
ncbi:bifunctional 5,10-methylene-tetrahydrofolate dehydrogenase/5,10-methylene-tetrahydrofolate cyclohydrolase [Candidatus Peregrinibacteria bacterium]|nr:bifunctional 5,10-methylene-tetrahydrofolate dehydrogenase/5,10-methylene-tetrahydrofolate cyclohydrolase [Candidatus Peregrinibacteria bacterium]